MTVEAAVCALQDVQPRRDVGHVGVTVFLPGPRDGLKRDQRRRRSERCKQAREPQVEA